VNFVSIEKSYSSICTPGCSLSVGRAMSLCPQDVGHACVTTGRRGISMPTFLKTVGSHLSRYTHRSLAHSVPITRLIISVL